MKNVGFIKDQKGILNRYRREKGNWESHLTKSKEYILQSAKGKGKTKMAILGSGWLLDVPINELVNSFNEIHLYDIFHPKGIVKKCSVFPNIKLIEEDVLSPLLTILYNNKDAKADDFLNAIANHEYNNLNFHDYDFVVSLNLLNQLDIIPIDYLSERVTLPNEKWLELRQFIQQKHLDSLPKNRSCIITDYQELHLNKGEEVIDTQELVFVPLPEKNSEKWIWHFDNSRTYYNDKNVHFRVHAGEL
ncbi:MAG: hypothetical protein PHU27_03600 [Salinivirgaceae bacterium]|nr:hypothetical protein [Salinivirgaceae bacterium]